MNAAARAHEIDAQEVRRALGSPDGLREQIREILDGTLSQAQLAREAGIGSSSLNQWLQASYKGNNETVERKLINWLQHRDRRLTMRALLPEPPAFVHTPTGEKIYAALSYAQASGDMVLVYGKAGTGKTSALLGYQDTNPSVWVATMSPASSSLGGALSVIHRAVTGRVPPNSIEIRSNDIRQACQAKGGLLIVDEAQHLQIPAIEEIRSIHDDTSVGVCFAGNDLVHSRLSGDQRSPALAQIYSRIGMRVKLRVASKGDVQAMAGAWGLDSAEAVGFLEALARKDGSLRNVNKTVRLAAMFARTNGNDLTLQHLESAWTNLSASA